jgi:hypothetical protein
MWRAVLLSLLLVLGAGRAADAQTIESVFRGSGVLGTWAANCAVAPGQAGNTHSIYAAAADGTVTLTYDNGPERAPTVYTILRAERRLEDRITYLQENRGDRRQLEIELLHAGDRIKVWSSRRTTGEILVANGNFTASGAESPWQVRCRPRPKP